MHERVGRERGVGLDLILGAALFLLSLVYFSATLDRTLNLRDEGYLLNMSSRVVGGELPHRDFVDIYGPGPFWLTALALEFGGGEIIAVRWGLAGIKALCVALCFFIMCRGVPRGVAFAGAIVACGFWGRESVNLNTPYAALYTLPFMLGSLLLVLRAGEDVGLGTSEAERGSRRAYLAAGVVAGLAALFKQSIAVTNGYALFVAIAAQAMLMGPTPRTSDFPGGESRKPIPKWLAPLGLACALLVLAPGFTHLTPRGYLLHLLPFHLVFAVVVIGVRRHALAMSLTRLTLSRLLPFAAGFAAVIVLLLVGYLILGGVGGVTSLVYDMFVLPLSLRNYAVPAQLPSPSGLALLAGGVSALAAGLVWLRGAERRALALATLSLVALAALFVLPNPHPRLFTPQGLWHASRMFDDVLSWALVVAAALVLWNALRGDRIDQSIALILPLAIFQALLCFQVYPRAGTNVWFVQGAFVPLAVALIWRGFAWATDPRAARRAKAFPPWKRAAAAAIALALPIWFVGTLVTFVLGPVLGAGVERRSLELRATRGIEPSLRAIERDGLGQIESLVHYIDRTRRPEARLLVLSDLELLYFVSGRSHLVPDLQFLLFLTAHGMPLEREIAHRPVEEILAVMAAAPDAIVVMHRSPAGERLARAMPGLAQQVERAYEVERSFGDLRLMRRR